MSTSPTAGTAPNVPEYSVGELSTAIKRTLETSFDHVRVRGEITEFMAARSGHLYLCLKDENAKIKGVMWKGTVGRLSFRPEDGLEVVATGKLTNYGPRSEYQLVIDSMEPAGAGALMALLEERRRKLAAEGLFDAARKRPIPFLPSVIGVVTSPTGAVIRDILHRLADRFPRHVLLWPVLVQGPDAAAQVAAAIRGFNALVPGGPVPRPDVLIVARGGGSLEDLWAFNEEIVVRAAAESDIPLISAVGHETDTTLIDYASDRRAPTPTAAAEMAVPVREDLLDRIAGLDQRHRRAARRLLQERDTALAAAARALPRPADMLGLRQQRFDELSERLPRALVANSQAHRHALVAAAGGLRPAVLRGRAADAARGLQALGERLPRGLTANIQAHGHRLDRAAAGLRPAAVIARIGDARRQVADRAARLLPAAGRAIEQAEKSLLAAGRVLESLSYQNVLKRGFAVIRDANDKPVTSSRAIASGDPLSIEFADGRVGALAVDGKPRPASPRKRAVPDTPQGDLF
ncbi:exodeoxyribonuclease VII large subunit [Iodidimonas sp. SYSU 1G8]|uniref:exodeoxyribonuclease VII large subunit n=1 Tax=Iodidimonas sp. SYSU 1G8 TaxID=3133967 RepID=UPI0031FEFFE7